MHFTSLPNTSNTEWQVSDSLSFTSPGFTHEQRAGFFGDPVDELGVLNDSVQQLLLGDGRTPGHVSLVVGALQRDAQAEETRPEQSGP